MTAWTAFVAVTAFLLLVVLVLARSTAKAVETDRTDEQLVPETDRRSNAPDTGEEPRPAVESPEDADCRTEAHEASGRADRSSETVSDQVSSAGLAFSSVPTLVLLANVIVSQGMLGAVLLGAAVLTEVPWSALGVTNTPWSTGLPAVAAGLCLGIALYVADEAVAAQLDAAGIDYSESLREGLTPETTTQWFLLLAVVLPVVAGFEELLFRAALIGAVPAGFPVSPAVMVVLSTVVFGLGHGLQGLGGILVTGLLGSVLGIAFYLSGSLLLVVVAHYVVNALEFLLHQWLEIDTRRWLFTR